MYLKIYQIFLSDVNFYIQQNELLVDSFSLIACTDDNAVYTKKREDAMYSHQ